MLPELVEGRTEFPLVEVQEGLFGEVWAEQFRDPHVWVEEDENGDTIYYMIVGSGIRLGEAAGLNTTGGPTSYGGTALLFSSGDLVEWEYHNPLAFSNFTRDQRTGMVWELPVFLPLGTDRMGNEKHILLISPWFSGFNRNAVKFVLYWTGTWDRDSLTFMPDHEEARLFDYGEHFTGPSGHC